MYKCKWNTFAPLPGLLAATLLAMGCHDSLAPERHGREVPAFSYGGTHAAVTGLGAIGFGLAIPRSERQEFDFDATETPGGRLFMRDFSVVRTDGSVGNLTADPTVDAATGINSFTQTSAACVTFGGIGRVDTGELVDFAVDACDHGSPGAGVDFFGISVPAFTYRKSGTLTEGEITRSGTPTTGSLDVTTATTGSDLDPDGYTVTVDGTTSQAIATSATVRFSGLAEGSHTVALSGVAANCTLSGSNPRTVTVVAGSVVSTTFGVTCTATTTGATRVTGLGAIGNGLAIPHMDRQEFDFEATGALSGRVAVTDYSVVRSDGVSVGRMSVDAATDPETGITSFSQTSATCVRFGGIGRLDTNELYRFFIDACDNASPGVGADTFTITLPDRGPDGFTRSGTLTEGDIVIGTTEPSPTTGDLTVTVATTGSDLDADGYTVTVDGTTSQAVATSGSATFAGLTSGDHSVALSGVAANCTVSGANPRPVTVPAGGVLTTTFSVSCAPVAMRLVFTVQPSNALPYPLATIQPPVQVTAVDAQGNRVTSYTGQVTITIGRDASLLGNAQLRGTRTVSAVNGVATFSDLSIDQPGIGYTLRATASGLTGAESATFTVLRP